ncbi:hypothetical protein KHA76_001805 [Salmonella enterica subsp. houtenae serovar 44:z36,[z38]:-]|uniref:Uncharacterized protein n=1 Tax=Salmonella enterica subsp. houtenae serovar 44:z36[z38]:- TaxID=1967609 RepID=A0A736I6P6_SALHO|nr:hypothetical protein [Salmonella enterica]EHM8757114.1 hypothetical protein [Salmonella enterica subsp. houtenae serovar 44:z36,[z38]:-]HAE7580907.1 hypothetical protein [Salmonella enterica subsp. houtenae serovar 44:z36[z38]:-]HCM6266701.1 hypothetical protein [Salmonella enterica subsp. houtenae serovar 44:z36,Z38:-]EGF3877528.1 hypothetical protein [Salmonella enterica]
MAKYSPSIAAEMKKREYSVEIEKIDGSRREYKSLCWWDNNIINDGKSRNAIRIKTVDYDMNIDEIRSSNWVECGLGEYLRFHFKRKR